MGQLVIRCPKTNRQIPTGYQADAATFRQMPIFFGVTYCPICRTDHEWFARDASVLDQSCDSKRLATRNDVLFMGQTRVSA